MTEKKFLETVKKLGGTAHPFGTVDFPESLRINNKKEAIDLLDILINSSNLTDGIEYSVTLDEPLKALRAAIKSDSLKGTQEDLHLLDIAPGRLPDFFREYEEAVKRQGGDTY
jgi:hypothetical protein